MSITRCTWLSLDSLAIAHHQHHATPPFNGYQIYCFQTSGQCVALLFYLTTAKKQHPGSTRWQQRPPLVLKKKLIIETRRASRGVGCGIGCIIDDRWGVVVVISAMEMTITADNGKHGGSVMVNSLE